MKNLPARVLAYLVLAGGVCIGYAACGASASSLCNDICECTGCSDDDLEDCIDNIEDVEKAAEEEGCEDEFDDALSCAADEFRCSGSSVDLDGCGSENQRLGNCLGGGIFFGGTAPTKMPPEG